jgi:hypothetical protein
LDICKCLLNHSHKERGAFLSCTVTDYEMCIRHCESESRCQSIEAPDLVKNFGSRPTVGKVMLTLLMGFAGTNLEHSQERAVMINTIHYSEVLHESLKLSIWGKC